MGSEIEMMLSNLGRAEEDDFRMVLLVRNSSEKFSNGGRIWRKQLTMVVTVDSVRTLLVS